jgi:hypothetical protein
MTQGEFAELVSGVTARIQGLPLDRALENRLQGEFPAGGETYRSLFDACRAGVAAGWMCSRGDPKRRFGRVVEPGPATHGFSVDVVELDDVAGPHHRHPNGEVCLVMPLAGPATFDGRGAGWVVYPPGSAHRPTVAGGKAAVLYLLPGGLIEFTAA